MKALTKVALMLILTAFIALGIACAAGWQGEKESWHSLVGSWQTTIAQKSLIISLDNNGQALVLFMQPGQHSTARVSWKPFHGGILVQGMPRIRLWHGRKNSYHELRAEIEAIPEINYDPDEAFVQHFFMRRISYEEIPKQWSTRSVPRHWTDETLDEEWNASAGKRRARKNEEK
jgi:hypothetical protein